MIDRTTRNGDKLLFTPGPLTTSTSIKAAMLRDLGSRDAAFIGVVSDIRRKLLHVAGQADEGPYTAVLMQGSGTFGIEAVLSTVVPRTSKLLILRNGAYGRRIEHIARTHNIDSIVLACPENTVPDLAALDRALAADAAITHVAAVHCETTTGILNPAAEIGEVVSCHGRHFILDAMSSFGGIPLDIAAMHITYLVSSSNKCIEGVPGFSFILALRTALEQTAGQARTLSLDLHAQWKGLEADGQFRFTPPTHAILAFQQALQELEIEGGPAGRAGRYQQNHETLLTGMAKLGFVEYLPRSLQSHIITAFRYPEHPRFEFDRFYHLLNDRGYVIYPGKLSDVDCFRIGTIGRVDSDDIRMLLNAVRDTLAEMEII